MGKGLGLRRKGRKLVQAAKKAVRRAHTALAKAGYASRYRSYCRNSEIRRDTLMFFAFQGDYTCNLKYISMEILRRALPWRQVWVTFDDPTTLRDHFPPEATLVRFNTDPYYRELAAAHILLDNAFDYVKGAFEKRSGQVFVETMHGSLGIKRIDAGSVRNDRRNDKGRSIGALTDYVLSNSSFETMVYETSFWTRESIVEVGHARNDIFFADAATLGAIRDKVCRRFGIPSGMRIALVAPTVRLRDEKADSEPIDLQVLYAALCERFGGEWMLLHRLHHSTKRETPDPGPHILFADDYPDIQELMIAADMAVTDYSSWIFDYVLTGKPGLLYMPDLDVYREARGFYYPLEEAPFPIAGSNADMRQKLLAFDEAKFAVQVRTFLDRRGCIDDGHASERIVDLLARLVEGQDGRAGR